MLIKQEFIDQMEFVEEQQKKQEKLAAVFEEMCPSFYCDTMIYCEYETHFLNLLRELFDDTDDLIGFKLYEFNQMREVDREAALIRCPEAETWGTVYDYLMQRLEEKKMEK